MSGYLGVALLSAVLILLGRLRFLKVLRSLSLPLVGLLASAVGLSLVEALHLEGTAWASAADIAFLVVLGYLAGRLLLMLVFDWILVRRMGLEVPRLGRDVLSLVIHFAVIATVLKLVLGLEVGALFATSAVITVIIGLSLQQTLGNLLAGIALAWEGRLTRGEWVQVGDVVGEVVEPGWRSIVLRTTLGKRVVIPNARMTEEHVTLLGDGHRAVGIEVDLSVGYDAAPDEVHRVLGDVLKDLPGVAADPPPQVLTRDLADNGIVYACRAWTTTAWSDLGFRSELLTRAYSALGRAGMEIPFPQRTLHVAPRRRPADPRPRLRAALEACDLFRGLPVSSMELLAATSRLLRFAPGEAVVREGEVSTAMYAIASGSVEVRQRRGNGDAVVGGLGAGRVFGEVAFLRGSPRLATVSASGPLEVVEIGEAALRDLLEQAPELAGELAQRVAAHERSTEEAAAADVDAPKVSRTAVAELLSAIWRRFGRAV